MKAITLGHGSGGRLTRDLVESVFCRAFSNPALDALGDSARLPGVGGDLAFTTDGFVVSPMFFPGGDIGRLAVNGTVNDLAVAGAKPLYLSASFILEEGLLADDLERVVRSMAQAAKEAQVLVVTGDTKVVEKGHGDGLYVVTAGVGRLLPSPPPGEQALRPGQAVLVSGPIGDHGAVVAAMRSGLEPEGGVSSDCASIFPLVEAIYAASVRPVFMRDPTRGGLATVLAEAARAAGVSIELDEEGLPIRPGVRGVCEVLGLDPLYLACEGRLVAVVEAHEAKAALQAMMSLPGGSEAKVAGQVVQKAAGPVILKTLFGGRRIYDTLASDPLPRIC